MSCVCARLPHFSNKSELNLHRSYILARTERPQDRTGASRTGQERADPNQRPPPAMALECSFARGVSLPAHRPPLGFTSYRLRHGTVRTGANHRVLAAARPVGAADAPLSQVRRRRGGGVASGRGGGGRTAIGAGARRLRAAAGRTPLPRRQNGG